MEPDNQFLPGEPGQAGRLCKALDDSQDSWSFQKMQYNNKLAVKMFVKKKLAIKMDQSTKTHK